MSSFSSFLIFFSWFSSYFYWDFFLGKLRVERRLMSLISSQFCLSTDFNSTFISSSLILTFAFFAFVFDFQQWHDFFQSYEKHSQNMNSWTLYHLTRTINLTDFLSSSTVRQILMNPRRWSRTMIVSSVEITRFQSSTIQFLYRRQKISLAAFISRISFDLKDDLTFL